MRKRRCGRRRCSWCWARLAAGSISSGLRRRSALRRFDERREMRPAAASSGGRSVLDPQPAAARVARRARKEAGTDIYARDPETGVPYGYRVKAGDTYELCAEFARASELRGDFWSHGAGKAVFSDHGEGNTAVSKNEQRKRRVKTNDVSSVRCRLAIVLFVLVMSRTAAAILRRRSHDRRHAGGDAAGTRSPLAASSSSTWTASRSTKIA